MPDKREKPLEERVLSFIRGNHLVEAGELLLVAVSGGPDSVSLVHILNKLKDELGIKLHIIHLNHQIRGAESEADARFVSELAQHLGIPATVEARNVLAYQQEKRLSLEVAAREVRYTFFAELGKKLGASRVSVGHTANDHIETILMHLIRGSGTRGLVGLKPETFWCSQNYCLTIIRPLLMLSRKETEAYCQNQNLTFRIDSSNLSLSPLRNRIRLELLPLLKRYNPEIASALIRTAYIAGDDIAFIDSKAKRLLGEIAQRAEGTIILNKENLLALPPALKRGLLRRAIEELSGDLRNIEMVHIEGILGILDKGAGKTLNLPHGLAFATDYNRYTLSKGEVSLSLLPSLEGEFPLKVPGETVIPGWRIVADVGSREEMKDTVAGEATLTSHFDWDKAGKNLVVRRCRRGDRFQPLGMGELKKVGEFMIDEKVPRYLRQNIPVVSSPQQIVCLVGLRIDERAKVREDTKRVLRLKFERS